MLKVDYFETLDDGSQEVILTVGLGATGLVVFFGDAQTARLLGLFSGPIRGKGGKDFWPKDGRAYLDAMQYQFTGSRLRASKAYEG